MRIKPLKCVIFIFKPKTLYSQMKVRYIMNITYTITHWNSNNFTQGIKALTSETIVTMLCRSTTKSSAWLWRCTSQSVGRSPAWPRTTRCPRASGLPSTCSSSITSGFPTSSSTIWDRSQLSTFSRSWPVSGLWRGKKSTTIRYESCFVGEYF